MTTVNVVTALGILISVAILAAIMRLNFNPLANKWWFAVGFSGLGSVALGLYYNNKGGMLQMAIGLVLLLLAVLMLSKAKA
jgi:ribosome-associated toxin RatA of RatAB toxin-antitoxin module